MKFTPLIVLFLVAVAVRQSASKYTTLLEDEPQDQDNEPIRPEKAKPTTVSYGNLIYDPQTSDQQSPTVETDRNNKNVGQLEGSKTEVTTKGDDGGGGKGDAGTGATVFSRLYSKVTSYLPFLAQLNNLRQPSGINATTSNDSELRAKTNVSVSMVRDLTRQIGQDEDQGKRVTKIKTLASGYGVNGKNNEGENSNSNAAGNSGSSNNDNNLDGGAKQDNQPLQNNDKQHGRMNVRISIDRTKLAQGNQADEQNQDDNEVNNHEEQDAIVAYNNFVGQFGRPIGQLAESNGPPLDEDQLADIKSGGQKRDQQFILEDNDNRNNYYNTDEANAADLDVDMSQMIPVALGLGNMQRFVDQTDQDDDDLQQQQPSIDLAANRYNMMRQSNLAVPISSNDALLTGAASGSINAISKQPENLLGKYIYAPTQHYYLNPVIPQPMAAGQQSHVLASGKHIQPGDHIYSSYGPDKPMKAAYSFSKDHNSIGDKHNDLYFLIMVGAFCMMATTIVLAAGLFAYRIQQSRKSSQDTGYPTYGVVGPNNMSAKCGAASFVGGYFTGPSGGGCDSSKSGSARHLADLYGTTPNGVGGSDSGLNSLDKSSSNKKASSVSSLNEFHQSATSRAASSNFMAAASQDAARMYHYQHQKQQMIISDRNSGGRQTTASDLDSEDENDDGSYTVYECPGLASAHEMEIKNPLFNDDQSP